MQHSLPSESVSVESIMKTSHFAEAKALQSNTRKRGKSKWLQACGVLPAVLILLLTAGSILRAEDGYERWGMGDNHCGQLGDPLIGGSPVDGLDGWFLSDWFGYYSTELAPWLFHAEHGWIYRNPSSTNASMYFYDDEMGAWCWTSESNYPYLYAFGPHADEGGTDIKSEWLFYFEESKGPRVFGVMTGASAGGCLFFGF
jgi:hypothetical protein